MYQKIAFQSLFAGFIVLFPFSGIAAERADLLARNSADSCCNGCVSETDWLDSIFSIGESFKDMELDFLYGLDVLDGGILSCGGELRLRTMDEDNRIRPGGPGRTTYTLWRWRNHLDFKADRFRLYVEMLDASQFGEELPVTGIDVNRWNVHNLFVDLDLLQWNSRPITFRVGRQELQYGSQQLVSSLEWGNTRRNFEGFRLISEGDNWVFDAFATRPVNTATFLNAAQVGGQGAIARFGNERDEVDDTRWFSGIYTVYRGIRNHTLDAYWVWLETDSFADAVMGPGSVGGDRHTIGLRWQTTHRITDAYCQATQVWNVELEGAYQWGKDNRSIAGVIARRTVRAGFFTSKIGVSLPQILWMPTVKVVYYWGSGDNDSVDGEDNTFCQLFPLGHAYWGLIDNQSGQNLHDYSVQGAIKPTKKLTILGAVHWFSLDSSSDALYNVAGVAFPATVPLRSKDVGEEFDLVATYAIHANLNVQFGYSWFWNGRFISQNIPRGDANQIYVQTTFKY